MRDVTALKAAIKNFLFPQPEPPFGEPLVVVSLPRSGGAFIREAVVTSMGLQQFHNVGAGMPVWAWLNAETMHRKIANKKVYLKAHFSAHYYHLDMCHNLGIRKLCIHMRDPRESILSFIYKLNFDGVRNSEATQINFQSARFVMASDHYSLTKSEQIDWMIENHLPELVRWMEQWLDVVDNDARFETLLTQYEMLERNEADFIRKICQFFDPTFDPGKVVLPVKKQNSFIHNFREGRSGGADREFNDSQKQRAKEIIGNKFTRFGWT